MCIITEKYIFKNANTGMSCKKNKTINRKITIGTAQYYRQDFITRQKIRQK